MSPRKEGGRAKENFDFSSIFSFFSAANASRKVGLKVSSWAAAFAFEI